MEARVEGVNNVVVQGQTHNRSWGMWVRGVAESRSRGDIYITLPPPTAGGQANQLVLLELGRSVTRLRERSCMGVIILAPTPSQASLRWRHSSPH